MQKPEGVPKKFDAAETYRGYEIKKHNRLSLRIDEETMKEIIDAEIETGLSQRKILALSSTPCECCKDSFVIYVKGGIQVQIKRGLMSKRIPKGSGTSKKRKPHD